MTKSSEKPLDFRAAILLIAGVLLAVGCFMLRLHILDQLERGPIAIDEDSAQYTWVAQFQTLHVLDPSGQRIAITNTQAQGVSREKLMDLSRADTGVFALMRSGLVLRCHLENDQIHCTKVPLEPALPPNSSGKIRVSDDGRWLAFSNNAQDQVSLYDLSARRQVSTTHERLNHPNGLVFLPNGLALADTGNYRLLFWPTSPGAQFPDLSGPPQKLLTTRLQPYYAEPGVKSGEWWVVEAGSLLSEGELSIYAQDRFQSTSALTLKDPSAFRKTLDGHFVLTGLDDRAIEKLEGSGRPLPSFSAALNTFFQGQETLNHKRERAAQWAIGLMVFFFFFPVLLLHLMGYALNQPVGKKVS